MFPAIPKASGAISGRLAVAAGIGQSPENWKLLNSFRFSWLFLLFLEFVPPNRDFSMGYDRFKRKQANRRLAEITHIMGDT
jgi:hypothetical protein